MALKIKRKTINKTAIDNAVVELDKIKQQLKLLGGRETELKDMISEYVSRHIKPDNKSNYLYRVLSSTGIPILFQRQARKKIVINQEKAVQFMRDNDLEDYISLQQVVAEEVTEDQVLDALIESGYEEYIDEAEVVTEDTLEEMINEGIITPDDLESFCDINITYAVYCAEEKMEE